MYFYGKNSIKIVQNANNITYGRYTIATRFIPKGCIISIENPIITYNSKDQHNIFYNSYQKKLIMNLHPVTNDINHKCHKNAFVISDDIHGVFYNNSMINHSCDPNVHYCFIFENIVMVATRDIMKDEEITISYIDYLKYDLNDRQNLLKKGWDFTCECSRCKMESSVK